MRTRFATLVIVATPLLTLTGCSFTQSIDQSEVETQIADSLEEQVGQRPDSVECPGDLDGEVGATMRCTLTAGDTKFGVGVEVTSVEDNKAKFDIKVDDQPMQ